MLKIFYLARYMEIFTLFVTFSDVEYFPFDEQTCMVRDEWRFISMVIDLFLARKFVYSSLAEERLIKDLFRGYNHLIRPVANLSNSPLEIRFSLALILLINVDEKNQIMQTNVWPTMKWIDYQMKWNPSDYENIRTIRVPPEKVWLPDIVLLVIESNGEMLWVPPAIYKSSCIIDVEFFPFDEQTCAMIFGSWTFNKNEVIISYLGNKRQVELNDYSESAIWDLMEVPGQLIHQKSKISYQIKIRRKTLFYTVILIIPTVLMAFLSMLVFYLPAEANEKITLAISILLALVVFLLLVSKILPPTSDTIPLMAKYLLMIFVLNIITIIVTVIIINIYFRGPTTHKMPPWVYSIFICKLPLLLMMNRPQNVFKDFNSKKFSLNSSTTQTKQNFKPGKFIEMNKTKKYFHHPNCSEFIEPLIYLQKQEKHKQKLRKRRMSQPVVTPAPFPSHRELGTEDSELLNEQVLKAMDAVDCITEHLRRENINKKIREEWRFVAMVIDRLLLYIFFGVTVGGTIGILCSAPNIFENVNQTQVITQLKRSAEAEMKF
ncbi:unnamed protein product [Meloidogyne enterolobii]|uniref:Uncharacterized protein n=1 Tax=Meloidogyne enterolobii TaxID=390850 RepID=A0ACB1AEL7_MELEN